MNKPAFISFPFRFHNPIGFKALYRKELKNLFRSPAAYTALLAVYFGAALPFTGSGYWFSAGFSDFRAFFLNIPFLFCIVFPLLTMNSWTDEKKYHTDRLLAAYPLSTAAIAAGKYAALLVWFSVMLLILLCIPLSVLPLVYFDSAAFLLSAAALFLFGTALAACSLAVSCIAEHAVISFILSFCTGFFFTVSHIIPQLLPLPAPIAALLRYCSFSLHFESAARGIFDTRDLIFLMLLAVSGFMLNVFMLKLQEERM